MRRLVIIAIGAAIGLGSAVLPVRAAAEDSADTTFYLGGIQVNEPDHRHWVDTLHEIGMNTVSVTVYAMQGAWDSDHLWWNDDEPSVIDEIRSAKARNLNVVLILRVAVDHAFAENEFVWHGMIMPRTAKQIDSWFAQYGRFVSKWAAIAEAEGVDVLGVGSEMNALTSTVPIGYLGQLKKFYVWLWYQRLQRRRALRHADVLHERGVWLPGQRSYPDLRSYLAARFDKHALWARQVYLDDDAGSVGDRRRRINDHWVRLIEGTRRLYSGKLTYAANFDAYEEVGFWEHLDLIGINSYFRLRDRVEDRSGPDGRFAQFKLRWSAILAEIRRFQQERGLRDTPILFTELGLTARENCTVEPWSHSGFSVLPAPGGSRLVIWNEQPLDPRERQTALAALHEVYREDYRDLLSGILYWKLSTIETHARIEPYVLHVGTASKDRLQEILLRFAR